MSDHPYHDLEPRNLWRHFAALNRIPRLSGEEGAARAYVREVAAVAGAPAVQDARGNLVVRAAASAGRETAPVVIVQAHLDMVCERRPEVQHDFRTEPIRPRREGDWILGSGTTLGADNGIGAAAALALLTDPEPVHGPLELLFTVEEETGLHGAAALDPSLLAGRLLVNLDSEDPKSLTIGCAGGAGAILRLRPESELVPEEGRAFILRVGGLKGGHSGVQIHEPLANAIRLLTRMLQAGAEAAPGLRLASLSGGNAHNAIPRDAEAAVHVPRERETAFEAAVLECIEAIRLEWNGDEPGFGAEILETAPPEGPALTPAATARLIELLAALPHGVLAMSAEFPGKVETSSNLAMVGTRSGPDGMEVEIATSSRSFRDEALEAVQRHITGLGQSHGAQVERRDGYGGWAPEADSPLLEAATEAYWEVFGSEPRVEVIHAGLECGVIARRVPGLKAISFGPRILGAHTPEERVEIPTVAGTWRLLTCLLDRLSR